MAGTRGADLADVGRSPARELTKHGGIFVRARGCGRNEGGPSPGFANLALSSGQNPAQRGGLKVVIRGP